MHGANMRDRLTSEITRKQFIQYIAGALLLVFGLDNLVSLLTGHKVQKHIYLPGQTAETTRGFGASKFGV
jgi:hypothetical protein